MNSLQSWIGAPFPIQRVELAEESNCIGRISVMVSPNQKWEYIVNKTSLNTLESDPDYQQFLEKEAVHLRTAVEA